MTRVREHQEDDDSESPSLTVRAPRFNAVPASASPSLQEKTLSTKKRRPREGENSTEMGEKKRLRDGRREEAEGEKLREKRRDREMGEMA
ncbi:hypothetical protein Dimus_037463 [Dionaea muscipula]